MKKWPKRILIALGVVSLIFGGATLGGALFTPTRSNAEVSQQSGCQPTEPVVQALNQAHEVDANNVGPVLSMLNALSGKKEVKAGDTINNPNGFLVYWTAADIDESKVVKVDNNGVVVALMGGGSGTVFAVYDTTITVPSDGAFLDNLCERINPSSQLTYWPDYKPAPAGPTGPTTDCVDPDELAKLMNQNHAIDENDPRPVMEWLESLGVGQAVSVGDTIKADQDSTVVWTSRDIDERRFERTSPGGTIVAYYGGGVGTVLGLYDGTWVTPVDGMRAKMCDRLNPVEDLGYWYK